MPYIPPEVVEQARQIDLLTYLQSCEPQELVRISGNNYTTRTHDSLKISNGKWMWWSQRIGGCNALDYGRFFKLYMYTALAPIPLSTFAGEPSQNVGKSFIKSYCAVCLEGAVIVLSCIIFSLFASSPPVVNPDAAAVTQVWSYIGELLFNMLVLVGSVKMSDRIIREMMGL